MSITIEIRYGYRTVIVTCARIARFLPGSPMAGAIAQKDPRAASAFARWPMHDVEMTIAVHVSDIKTVAPLPLGRQTVGERGKGHPIDCIQGDGRERCGLGSCCR